jgi:hypothetical protein
MPKKATRKVEADETDPGYEFSFIQQQEDPHATLAALNAEGQRGWRFVLAVSGRLWLERKLTLAP